MGSGEKFTASLQRLRIKLWGTFSSLEMSPVDADESGTLPELICLERNRFIRQCWNWRWSRAPYFMLKPSSCLLAWKMNATRICQDSSPLLFWKFLPPLKPFSFSNVTFWFDLSVTSRGTEIVSRSRRRKNDLSTGKGHYRRINKNIRISVLCSCGCSSF